MYAEVRALERLSPDLLRLTFSGGTLDQFEGSEATDAYVIARFVPEGSPITVPFEQQDLDDLLPEHQPRPRRFSIREWDEREQTLVIDFVVHGESGSSASLPTGKFDVFVHGEAAEVRALRQHLVDDRRVGSDTASISAYWRRDHTDEDWRKIKREFMATGVKEN